MNWVPTQIDDFEWYEENVTRLFSEEPYFWACDCSRDRPSKSGSAILSRLKSRGLEFRSSKADSGNYLVLENHLKKQLYSNVELQELTKRALPKQWNGLCHKTFYSSL